MLATRAFHRMAVSLPRLKGFFGGSGRDLLCKEAACDDIIGLTQKAASDVTVLYLGTATYDNDGARRAQTDKFDYAGCKVVSLDVVWDPVPGPEEIENKINSADIIVVSGGNTLYAVDTWRKLNIDTHLKKAMERGAVLSGGSAGAICWFDGGHSDSMDPSSYKKNLKQQDEGKQISSTFKLTLQSCRLHGRTFVLMRWDFCQDSCALITTVYKATVRNLCALLTP